MAFPSSDRADPDTFDGPCEVQESNPASPGGDPRFLYCAPVEVNSLQRNAAQVQGVSAVLRSRKFFPPGSALEGAFCPARRASPSAVGLFAKSLLTGCARLARDQDTHSKNRCVGGRDSAMLSVMRSWIESRLEDYRRSQPRSLRALNIAVRHRPRRPDSL